MEVQVIIDTHITLSFGTEGTATIDDVLRTVKELPIDGVCILGWNRMPPAGEIRAKAAESGVPVFFGIEIASGKGSLLCYPPDIEDGEVVASIDSFLSAGDYEPSKVIDFFHEEGGAVVASFPYGKETGFGDQIFHINGLDGIEIATPVEQRRFLNRALEVAGNRRAHGLGGSGRITDVAVIGRAATLFLNSVSTQEEFAAEIVKGHIWAEEFLMKLELQHYGEERQGRPPRERRDFHDRRERGGRDGRERRFDRGFRPNR